MTWSERQSQFQNLWCHNLVNKQLQYGSQVMQFCYLIKYNIRNIFLTKSYTKCGGETILRPFFKISKLSISGSRVQSFIQFAFIVCQVEGYRNILKLSLQTIAFTSYKAFLKNEKRSRTCLPASFSAWFLKRNISLVIIYYLSKFHCQVAFTSWDIGQYVYWWWCILAVY